MGQDSPKARRVRRAKREHALAIRALNLVDTALAAHKLAIDDLDRRTRILEGDLRDQKVAPTLHPRSVTEQLTSSEKDKQ